jgi:fructose-1,6-bisphosphatase/inositol monophosphatase family enzyme
MVALLEAGVTVASWIWQPSNQRMYTAARGEGAWCDGRRLRSPTRAASAHQLRGAVHTGFLDPERAALVERNRNRFADVRPGRHCAGVDYPRLIEGDRDFVLYWRTLPWDHAPGALLAHEAGAVALRPDGSTYDLTDDTPGLLVAGDRACWALARGILD